MSDSQFKESIKKKSAVFLTAASQAVSLHHSQLFLTWKIQYRPILLGLFYIE